MRRWAPLLLIFAAGCTNAPIANFLDMVSPSRIPSLAGPGPIATGDVAPPSPPSGVRLQPPPAIDSGFAPPLVPNEPSPLPPPVGGVGPLGLPNT